VIILARWNEQRLTNVSLPFAFLISPLEHVVRSDGTRIRVSAKLSTRAEIKQIKVTMTSKLILLSGLFALWSFFYGYVPILWSCTDGYRGTWSTYLATYFNTRSRALSSLISPFFCMYVSLPLCTKADTMPVSDVSCLVSSSTSSRLVSVVVLSLVCSR
jgi:hypothetical protein